MKKIYFQPSIEVVETQLLCIICSSNGIHSNNGIRYGGVDTDGTKDPSARAYDYYEEDEEDME